MKWFILTASVFAIIVPAMAQTVALPPECRIFPEHRPAPDVAYRPGMDVHGKPVIPADVNPIPFDAAGQTVVVPLTVDLAERLQGQGIDGLELEGNLGYLEIYPDGRVSHNGRDWTTQVYVLCGKQPILPDRQPSEDVIKYDAEPADAISPDEMK